MENRSISDYTQTRAKWEPLYEITQIKGDGETHPFLSMNDEFADYGTWDLGNLNLSVPKKKKMLEYEYARSALKMGLSLEAKTGTNPYKFGVIGSTDAHTALAPAGEDNFFGKHSGGEPAPDRWEHALASFGENKIMNYDSLAAGWAAVWAEENTREAIFDAMMRRETYATTGSRIIVRFFGGWNFVAEDGHSRMPAEVGYAKGVPMGGDLPMSPDGAKAPTFLIGAMKDPLSGNLDRVQIIKGWLDGADKTHERVYDVMVSDGRKIDADGSLPHGSRQHGEHGQGDMDKHDRRAGNDFHVDRPRLQSEAPSVLLCSNPRDSHAHLGRLRCCAIRADTSRRSAASTSRARVTPIWYTP